MDDLYKPDIVILSSMRCGTHLLQSLLGSHPDINIMGEIFLQLSRGREVPPVVEGKVNICILMYYQMKTFEQYNGSLKKFRVIHLKRDPLRAAISIIQRKVDKEKFGSQHSAHAHKSTIDEYNKIRGNITKENYNEIHKMKDEYKYLLDYYSKYLVNYNVDYINVNYEDFVDEEKSIDTLNKEVADKILNFIGGINLDVVLTTKMVKTGLTKDTDIK